MSVLSVYNQWGLEYTFWDVREARAGEEDKRRRRKGAPAPAMKTEILKGTAQYAYCFWRISQDLMKITEKCYFSSL